MFINNYLNLPVTPFKKMGIESGNEIYKALASKGLTGIYNPDLKRVVVLNSSKLSQEELQAILYTSNFAQGYINIYPKIDTKGADGNWLVKLEAEKPKIPPYTPPAGYLSDLFDTVLPDDVKTARKLLIPKFEFPLEELKKAKAVLGEMCVESMKILMHKNEGIEGPWFFSHFKEQFPKYPSIGLFEAGYLDSRNFTQVGPYSFELLPGVKPSAAIESIFKKESVSIIDCGMGVSLCYIHAILKFVGSEKFDKYFAAGGTAPLRISIKAIEGEDSLLTHFTRYTRSAKKNDEGSPNNRPLEVGDGCTFFGVNFFVNKHPKGTAQGWNAVYAGRNNQGAQVFAAFGFDKLLTEEEVIELMIEEYNEERTADDKSALTEADNIEFLKRFYTVSKKDLSTFGVDSFLDGYYHSSTMNLEPKFVLALQKTDDIKALKTDLAIRNEFFKLSVIQAMISIF